MNKKVLLVGGSGFVGNELGEALAKQGTEIHLLSRNPQAVNTLAYPAKKFAWT